jgi:hypothetical protein
MRKELESVVIKEAPEVIRYCIIVGNYGHDVIEKENKL